MTPHPCAHIHTPITTLTHFCLSSHAYTLATHTLTVFHAHTHILRIWSLTLMTTHTHGLSNALIHTYSHMHTHLHTRLHACSHSLTCSHTSRHSHVLTRIHTPLGAHAHTHPRSPQAHLTGDTLPVRLGWLVLCLRFEVPWGSGSCWFSHCGVFCGFSFA